MKTTVTEIVYGLVFDGPVPAKAVAMEIGKPYPTLHRELNTRDDGGKLGVEDFVRICRAVGSLEPLRFIARQMDGAVLDLSGAMARVRRLGGDELQGLALEAAKDFGEFAQQLRTSLVDGTLSGPEFSLLEKRIWEAVEGLLLVLEAARKFKEGK